MFPVFRFNIVLLVVLAVRETIAGTRWTQLKGGKTLDFAVRSRAPSNRNLPQIPPSQKKRRRSTRSTYIITKEFDTYDTHEASRNDIFLCWLKGATRGEERTERQSVLLSPSRRLFTDGRAADECVQILLTTPSAPEKLCVGIGAIMKIFFNKYLACARPSASLHAFLSPLCRRNNYMSQFV